MTPTHRYGTRRIPRDQLPERLLRNLPEHARIFRIVTDRDTVIGFVATVPNKALGRNQFYPFGPEGRPFRGCSRRLHEAVSEVQCEYTHPSAASGPWPTAIRTPATL